MLVLSRRLHQAIIVDGQVKITVIAISPSRIELGIEAPREIEVDREEVFLRKTGEQHESTRSPHDVASFQRRAEHDKPRREPPSISYRPRTIQRNRDTLSLGYGGSRKP